MLGIMLGIMLGTMLGMGGIPPLGIIPGLGRMPGSIMLGLNAGPLPSVWLGCGGFGAD